MTAHNAVTGDQITRYIYGSSINAVAPLIHRNDLLAAEIFPDSCPNDPFDRVTYSYNRVGERIFKRDQNGTTHEYHYDNLGRLLHDNTPTLGDGVNNSVRRISTVFTPDGHHDRITSYDNPNVGQGNITNQIVYEYDSCGLLSREFQNPSGAATVASRYVGYTYDTTKSGDYFTKHSGGPLKLGV